MSASRDVVWARIESPVGRLTLVAGEAGLRGVWFEDETHPALDEVDRVAAGALTDQAAIAGRGVAEAARQFGEYFDGSRSSFDIALDLRGTPFQRQVWAMLAVIPCGETRTYGAIATEISRSRAAAPTSARAVAAAVGRTPIPIIVPCHRVIGADGSLTGYRGGLHRKRALLELEGAAIVGAAPEGPLARATASPGQLPLL